MSNITITPYPLTISGENGLSVSIPGSYPDIEALISIDTYVIKVTGPKYVNGKTEYTLRGDLDFMFVDNKKNKFLFMAIDFVNEVEKLPELPELP